MRDGIADIDAHRLVPAIGDTVQPRIEGRAQLRDQIGQRIGKIFVFAAPKAVAAHHDAAAEVCVVGIERSERSAFIRRQQSLQDGAALRVEIGGYLRPVDGIDAGGDVGERSVRLLLRLLHVRQFRSTSRMMPPDFRELPTASSRRTPGPITTGRESVARPVVERRIRTTIDRDVSRSPRVRRDDS